METASETQRREMIALEKADPGARIEGMLKLFRACGVDAWARELKRNYLESALRHLEDTAVLSRRKEPLQQLAAFLVQRDF